MIVEGLKSNHPLFRGLKTGIATNRPSFLRHRDADLVALAEFSSDTFRDPSRRWAPEPRPRLFLCGSANDAPPAGRMVVLSGEGVFINSMIAASDNDNFNFAWNTIKWLAEGPKGKRRYALVLEDGRPVPKFALPLTVSMPGVSAELAFKIFN